MMWRLKGRGWKDMGLLSQNMKSCIFHNGHENISHNIMRSYLFLTMCTMKKMYPHKIQRLATCNATPQGLKGWERPNLMRNAMKKTSKGRNLKSCISCNGYKNISHNIMWGYPFFIMHTTKKVYFHKIQRLTTNAMWHPKD